MGHFANRVMWLLACSILIIASDVTAQPRRGQPATRRKSTAPRQAARAAEPLVSVAVLPLRQSTGDAETSTIGAGIADTLTNVLKGIGKLAVADTNVFDSRIGDDTPRELRTDEEVASRGRQLGLTMLVNGSYQVVGGQLIVDARIVSAATSRSLPGSGITLSARFPDEYADLLRQLSDRVIKAMRLTVSAEESTRLKQSMALPESADAVALYNKGVSQMRRSSQPALEAAVQAFADCLDRDPGYALAYAAKAEAEGRLAELRSSAGQPNRELATQAVNDAVAAVRRNPGLGRAQRALATAHNLTGNYAEAAVAARRAVSLQPNDAASRIDLNRAVNQGHLVRTPDLERTLQLQPWVAYVVSVFPKVVVRNDSSYEVTATATPINGTRAYPSVRVPANLLRVLALLPGTFTVALDSAAGELVKEYTFEANTDYEIRFQAKDIATTRAVLTNRGNAVAIVVFKGPTRSKSLTVNPGGTGRMEIQSGVYKVTCAGSSGGAAKTLDATLKPGEEYVLDCSITRTIVTRRR